MSKTVTTVDLSNTASAYYAPATVAPAGKLVHVAGQAGSLKDGSIPSDYESQIHLALLNLRKIIVAAGSSIENIVKLNLFIVNYIPVQNYLPTPLFRVLSQNIYITYTVYSTTILWSIML
jgi:monoamine oxidase